MGNRRWAKLASQAMECGTKRRLVKKDAHKMAIRRAKETGERFEPYKCWSCGKWHIGHRS